MKIQNVEFSKSTGECDGNLIFCHNAWLGQLVMNKMYLIMKNKESNQSKLMISTLGTK